MFLFIMGTPKQLLFFFLQEVRSERSLLDALNRGLTIFLTVLLVLLRAKRNMQPLHFEIKNLQIFLCINESKTQHVAVSTEMYYSFF